MPLKRLLRVAAVGLAVAAGVVVMWAALADVVAADKASARYAELE